MSAPASAFNYEESIKRFTYFGISKLLKESEYSNNYDSKGSQDSIPNNLLNKYLELIGREIMRDEAPSLQDIETKLQATREQMGYSDNGGKNVNEKYNDSTIDASQTSVSIIAELERRGYLKDSNKWLSKKGFLAVGGRLLHDVMKALKNADSGMHETTHVGSGSLLFDTTKKYEAGNDIRLLNVPKSMLNAIERMSKTKQKISIPVEITIDDLEEYETKQDVRMSVVYCIDLSSTMRYSTMYGDMSRIEAAKRALWSLYFLNQKYFSSDSIYIIGFGALASKVSPFDIPYLKTFEPGSDFLHYTNYQAAFRLARKVLQKDGSVNKRIVMVTDGHPSACFVDTPDEREKILSQRPYSQFYAPETKTLNAIKKNLDMVLDTSSGRTVYLCYRYRQVDQYIGEKTILEARKCHNTGIEIDTIMISEEDSLLSYVNELERLVKGRSYYINPADIDKILLTDYLNNKKIILSSHT